MYKDVKRTHTKQMSFVGWDMVAIKIRTNELPNRDITRYVHSSHYV